MKGDASPLVGSVSALPDSWRPPASLDSRPPPLLPLTIDCVSDFPPATLSRPRTFHLHQNYLEKPAICVYVL